ncbi:signal peptidase I [Enterococcus sp. LJL98]
MKKKMQRTTQVLGTFFVLGVLAFALLNFYSSPERPSLFGHRGYTVISGSMAPALAIGDYILVKEKPFEQLEEEEIISFRNGQMIVTHRIEKVLADQHLITRGDANQVDDLLAVTEKEYIGSLVYRIPKLGHAMIWLQNPLVFSLILGAIATRFAVLFINRK